MLRILIIIFMASSFFTVSIEVHCCNMNDAPPLEVQGRDLVKAHIRKKAIAAGISNVNDINIAISAVNSICPDIQDHLSRKNHLLGLVAAVEKIVAKYSGVSGHKMARTSGLALREQQRWGYQMVSSLLKLFQNSPEREREDVTFEGLSTFFVSLHSDSNSLAREEI
jgi:hypothetical protein